MKTLENPTISLLKEEVTSLQEKLLERDQEVFCLQEQIEWFKQQLFGAKSEKVVADLELGDKGFVVTGSGSEKATIDPKKGGRKTPVRTGKDAIKLPPGLPVETIIIDLPEKDKICKETGLPLVKIGEEVTHKLAHRPGSYFIQEIIRFKYANPGREEQGILCPELPTTIFPKCRAADSLLAEIMVDKFANHLPLFRISEIMEREGIGISRKLLSQWTGHCGRALIPLYNEMLKRVLLSGNIFVDESPVNIQAKGGLKKGYMWVLVGGNESNPAYRVYSFAENRCHQHILDMLDTYEGDLHSDKYGAYVKLAKKNVIFWNPCWAHIRRYFFEVEFGDLEFCSWVLRRIRYLYMLERVAWNRSPEERIRIRKEKEVPIIDELIQKIKDRIVAGGYLPKSKFSKALNYFSGLIPYLKNYTRNAYSNIDNNNAERAIRPLAIGRKNWLFFGSLAAGQSAAIILSLVQTCRGLKINPREYLEDVFRRLLDHNSQKLHELLPDQWLLNRSQS